MRTKIPFGMVNISRQMPVKQVQISLKINLNIQNPLKTCS